MTRNGTSEEKMDGMITTGINEYNEELTVQIGKLLGEGPLIIHAEADEGMLSTEVDLVEVLRWVHEEMPDLWNKISAEKL